MKYAFIAEHCADYPVTVLCTVIAASRSGFYEWLDRKPSARQQADAELEQIIEPIFLHHRKRYGSPRIWWALRKLGRRHSNKRVARLMRKHGWSARKKKRFVHTTRANPNDVPAPNVLNREFQADAPNRKWVSDIKQIDTAEGSLYLGATLDLFSKMIVGWAMDEVMDASLTARAFDMAVQRRCPNPADPGLLHHSDRGSQYTATLFRARLQKQAVTESNSRTGDCWDNAPMEAFFSTLTFELLNDVHFETRDQAKQEVFNYIETYYNRERMHSALGYRSPTEFEASAKTNSPVRQIG